MCIAQSFDRTASLRQIVRSSSAGRRLGVVAQEIGDSDACDTLPLRTLDGGSQHSGDLENIFIICTYVFTEVVFLAEIPVFDHF